MKRKSKLFVLMLFALILIGFTLALPPFNQDLSYHDFADQRQFLKIPNAFDVFSNFFIFLMGCLGLRFIFYKKLPQQEKILWKIFFSAVVLTAIFSAYYHLDPDNQRLSYDRLALSLLFTTFFLVLLEERINHQLSKKLLIPLMILGLLSVIYWIKTENLGQGDLRFYGLIQFGPIIMLPLVFLLFPSKYTHQHYLYATLFLYGLAKLAEVYDREIFKLLDHKLSGHTAKHLLSGMGLLFVLIYIKTRKVKNQHD